jgi:hypothetical protein
MPCGYTFPTITASFQYIDETVSPPQQNSATTTYTPQPSNWYSGNFCGWADVSNNEVNTGLSKAFYFPGPLFRCPSDSRELLFFRPRAGFNFSPLSSLDIGYGLGNPNGTKAGWMESRPGESQKSLSGFDFEDWYWSCNTLIIGSFSRSKIVTIDGEQFNVSVSVTVP